MRLCAKVIAEVLEVLVEMQDANGSALGGRGYGQVGQGIAVGTMRAGGGQLPHRCQDGAPAVAIHRDLAQALQGALDGGDRLGASGVNKTESCRN